MKLIRYSLILTGLCALALALPAQGHKQQRKYFPKEINSIYLGMSLEEFARARPRLAPERLSRDGIRYRWTESFPQKSSLVAAIYYFGEEGEKPLYEIVLLYRDLSDRGEWVRKKLGPPNFNDREWKLASAEGFLIHAWLHEEKLIFAAELKGTEWEEQ
jgi:hypothetical protein